MVKRLFVIFFLFAATLAHAGDSPVLLRMAKSDGPRTSRIMLVFSALPGYRVRVTGRRIDLTLSASVMSPKLAPLPEDGSVVAVFSGRQGSDLLVSFLLKRQPVRVNAVTANNPASIVLELSWAGKAQPPIPRLVGEPTLQRGQGPAQLVTASPYSGHWEDFYRDYLVPIRIAAPMRYLCPPFPWPGLGALPAPSLAAARAGDWKKAAALLTQAAAVPPNAPPNAHRPEFMLAAAAAFLEAGDGAAASKVLADVGELPAASSLKAYKGYLEACARAVAGDPYGAAFALAQLPAPQRTRQDLAPFFKILSAEVAVVTGASGSGIKAFSGGKVVYPPSLQSLRRLRQADLLFAAGEREQAHVAYRQLEKDQVLHSHPWSLAAYAETLLAHDQYRRASVRYLQLAHLIAGQPDAALALYGSAWAHLALGETKPAMKLLSDILSRYPKSVGASRATLKINDVSVLGDKKQRGGTDALRVYRDVAAHASSFQVREVAAFKAALTESLQGERRRAVDALDAFLQDFASGTLCAEARARLLELLPPTVTDLLHRRHYVEALALVEKNHDLILADRVGHAFLLKVGNGFGQLGLWGRAVNVFSTLNKTAKTPREREASYLPLLKALYHQGAYADVLKYALRYQQGFPQGKHRTDVFLWRLKALIRSDKTDEAVRLLKEKKHPDNLEIDLLAGHVFWARKDYRATAGFLRSAMDRDLQSVSPEDRLLRAEALFLDGQFRQALPLYQTLREVPAMADQALYRCAQIDLKTGNRPAGLNLLRKLAETGKSTGWQDMARQTLALEAM